MENKCSDEYVQKLLSLQKRHIFWPMYEHIAVHTGSRVTNLLGIKYKRTLLENIHNGTCCFFFQQISAM